MTAPDDTALGPGPGTLADNPRWRWVRRLAPWVITAVVVTAILVKYPLGRIVEEMQRGDVLAMAPVALAATLVMWFTATTGDFVLLRPLAPRLRFLALMKGKAGVSVLNALGLALNYGGFALWIQRVVGCPWRTALGVILMLTLADLGAVSIVALGALIAGGDGLPAAVRDRLVVVAPALGGVALALLLAARPVAVRRGLFEPWRGVPRGHRAASVVARMGTISVLVVSTWAAARAFGLPVPFHAWASFLPVLLVVGALPVNVAGLGPVQAAWLLLFAPWASGPQILAFQFLWHLAMVCALFLRGAPFLRAVVGDIARGQGRGADRAAPADRSAQGQPGTG